MTLFLLSLVPLVFGPFLVRLFQTRPGLTQAFNGFIILSVGGIIFLHILPHSIEMGGRLAALTTVLGIALPFLIERWSHDRPKRGMRIAVVLGLLALAIHGMLDGVALAASSVGADRGTVLALGVILHRIPVGLTIWWIAVPRLGVRGAIVAIATLVATSTLGFGFAYHNVSFFEGTGWFIVQALLAGSLLHVVAHQLLEPDDGPRWKVASTIGALLGIALLLGLSHISPHDHDETTLGVGDTFLTLALASAPPLVVGFIVAGVFKAFTASRLVSWLRRGSGRVLKGTLVGLPLNICSCSIIPMYRAMIVRGVPGPVALAFFVAAPEIGIATVFLTITLLGFEVGVVRTLLAILLGLAVGLIAGASIKKARERSPSTIERARTGLAGGFGDIIDHTLPWILAGLGIAALLEPLLDPELFKELPSAVQIPLAALVGAPFYVCATGSTPMVALLMHKGLSAGAAMAFLLTGPATNVTTWGVLAALHGKRTATMFALAIAVAAIAMGFGVDLFLTGDLRVPLHAMHTEDAGIVAWASLGLLGLLTLVSLLRQGASGFVQQIMKLFGHDHDHEHDLGRHHHHHH